jgi:hypothetical protein
MFISPARTITGLLFHKWSLANSFTSESERHVFFFFFFFSPTQSRWKACWDLNHMLASAIATFTGHQHGGPVPLA